MREREKDRKRKLAEEGKINDDKDKKQRDHSRVSPAKEIAPAHAPENKRKSETETLLTTASPLASLSASSDADHGDQAASMSSGKITIYKTYVPSMIPSARPTVSPVAIYILTWKLFKLFFCEILKSGDGQTDTKCEFSNHYWINK